MTKSIRAAVAASLDAPAEALPLIPELFASLTALGSQPRRVVVWLRAAGVGPGQRVLDLGCGKGAVSITLARALGCRLLGVDAFGPFVEAARERAQVCGVGGRCEFLCKPIEPWRRCGPLFDVVMMLGVWPLVRAAAMARRLTRPGGAYLIDDCVRVQRWTDDEAVRGVPTARQARAALEDAGDRVERWHVLSKSAARRHETALYDRLRRQAARMGRRDPDRRPLLRECLRRQREAIRALSGPLRASLWLVRRGGHGQ